MAGSASALMGTLQFVLGRGVGESGERVREPQRRAFRGGHRRLRDLRVRVQRAARARGRLKPAGRRYEACSLSRLRRHHPNFSG
jgi:hypothetical protein